MRVVDLKYSGLYRHGKVMLVASLLSTTIFSCSKEEFQTEAQEVLLTEAAIIDAINPNLLFEETFDSKVFFPLSGTTINKTHGIENCNDNSTASDGPNPWTLTNSNGRGRFELRKGVLTSKSDYRSEVTIIKGTEDSRFTPEMWYSYDVMMPKDGGGPAYRKSINQWYEDGSDELTTRSENGYVYLELQNSGKTTRWDLFSEKVNGASTSGFTLYPLDEWHNFVFHIIHTTSSDGLIEVWRDGKKIHTYNGATIHTKLPKWKIGLYASQRSSADVELIYFDNIRVGKKGTTLNDMLSDVETILPDPDPTVIPTNSNPIANAGSDISITLPANSVTLAGKASDSDGSVASIGWTKVSGPGQFTFNNTSSLTPVVSDLVEGTYVFRLTVTDNGGAKATDDVAVFVKAETNNTTIIEPTGSLGPVTSFVLINSATEEDILTITDGATYSLSQLGVTELNIRADAPSSTGMVLFDLKGPQTSTSKDKRAPFALMGDDGNGRYYHGIWDPPAVGTYTLNATTYETAYVTSASGGTRTITFTITK